MPTRTPCPKCRKTGFVRYETILKGGHAYRAYYCGACNYSWDVTYGGSESITIDPPERPDRSRSKL